MQDIKLVGKKILVRKCVTGEPGSEGELGSAILKGVAIPAKTHEFQHWCEIVKVSDQCSLFTKDMEGKAFIRLTEWRPNYIYRYKDEDFIVKESLFTVSKEDGGLPAYIVWE